MPIGVVGYTVRFRTFTAEQIEETYKKIAALGYDGMENGLGGRVMSPAEDLALLDKYGLKVADAYGDITKPDEAMKMAEAYGVKILGVGSVPGEMLNSPEGFYAYAERMNKLAQPFKAAGYRLQYHNHSQEFRNFPSLGGKSGMAILIEETDPEAIAFELDVHWMTAAGADPSQWIRKVKGRIPIVHFKDYAIDHKAEDVGLGSVPKRFAEVGQGNINWPPILEACKDAGVEWYCVEQDRTQMDEFASLKLSIDYMRGIGVK
jgi:sugar phosphate isomerase/epimerase